MRTIKLLGLLSVAATILAACDRTLPTQSRTSPTAVTPRATFATGTYDFEVCSNGSSGSYTVAIGAHPPGAPVSIADGACQVVYTYPTPVHGVGDTTVTVTYQAQIGVVLDSILKDSSYLTLAGTINHSVTKLTGTSVVSSTVNNDAAAQARFYFSIPSTGCTLTIGFWKTHAGFGPQADVVTPLLPQWLGTAGGAKSKQVTTASQAVNYLTFQGQASNPVNKLYGQLLGAKLNIASGASATAVASVIAASDAFLATHDNLSVLTNAQKATVNGWASALDNYNNGLTGPGHCGS